MTDGHIDQAFVAGGEISGGTLSKFGHETGRLTITGGQFGNGSIFNDNIGDLIESQTQISGGVFTSRYTLIAAVVSGGVFENALVGKGTTLTGGTFNGPLAGRDDIDCRTHGGCDLDGLNVRGGVVNGFFHIGILGTIPDRNLIRVFGTDLRMEGSHPQRRVVGLLEDGTPINAPVFFGIDGTGDSGRLLLINNSAESVPGDTHPFDGVVNIVDLNNVRNNFGASGSDNGIVSGDTFPFDGIVNIIDLNGVRNNFGASAAVPEPSTLALASLFAFVAVVARRRRS